MAMMLLLFVLVPILTQDRADEPSKPPKRGDIVIAKGCLRGGVLESADLNKPDGGARSAEFATFRLTGDKKTMDEIRKEHDGHSDAITGELGTDLPSTTQVRGKQIGKTRITVGVGPSRGMGPEPPPPMPVLRVTSIEHTGTTCR
jgi:hypothetical protein